MEGNLMFYLRPVRGGRSRGRGSESANSSSTCGPDASGFSALCACGAPWATADCAQCKDAGRGRRVKREINQSTESLVLERKSAAED
ncbi:hypothetical protein NDU88_002095 [Pleurodeles waltl]|uniref:Uncharacterized protein n=1 Tax=Pleurodeles waltl TaxID=8319 RepID=A0AAV7Q506_PLEWA|nr:hypothetical protein NDU88_002095 [Pleurodeles waltl]